MVSQSLGMNIYIIRWLLDHSWAWWLSLWESSNGRGVIPLEDKALGDSIPLEDEAMEDSNFEKAKVVEV